jgi:hypothetical protein
MKPARIVGLVVPLALLAFGLSLPARAAIPGWTDKTVGSDTQGSASVDANGVWTINGSGNDVWATEDQFHIVYKPLSGDGSVTTKLLSAGDVSEWQKTGVMMREDLDDPAAKMMTLERAGAEHGGESVIRGETGYHSGKDRQMTGDLDALLFPSNKFPIWLKVERRGINFTPYASLDGAFWVPVYRPKVLPMKSDIFAGAFVCSHSDGDLLAATFDGNVTDVSSKLLKPEEAAPLQPSPVVVLGGDNSVMLTWERVNHLGKDADGYAVYKAKIGDATFTKLADVPGDKTSYVDNTIKNGEIARYRVTTIVKLGPAADKIVESQVITGKLYEVAGSPNPTGPVKIGDRDFFADVLAGGLTKPVTEMPGSASIDASGVLTLRATGWDIQNEADGGEQLLTPVSGDFTLTARVLGVPTAETGDVNEWAKFGIAVRESTSAESRYLAMLITPQHGIRAPHYRPYTSAELSTDTGPNEDTPTFPIFFRMQRRGDELKLFTSADGKTFAEYGNPATTVLGGLNQNVYVGFIGTAHDGDTPPNQVAVTKFDQITLTTP